MNATLLTIGDELLIGQVVNTNASWLGEQLNLLGIDLRHVVTIGDDLVAIEDALGQALAATDLVLITGGLGPTPDDLTVEAVARFFGVELRLHEHILAGIEERFRRRGRTMTPSNRKLALVPEGFEVLPNAVGTAPGLWRQGIEGGDITVILPGVPKEMKTIFLDEVVPRLQQQEGLRVIAHRTLLTAGIGESTLHEKVGDLSDLLGPTLRLAYLPSTSGVRLRMTATGADRASANQRLDVLEARLRDRAGRYIYGTDDDSLEAAVGRLLKEQGLTIAVAESCTGGLVAHRLTNVPGSSAYFVGGVVAYSNGVKMHQLGVEEAALAEHGAVSEVVAQQMAQGVRSHLNADIGLATTGVAGPSGGTPDKPVGTVWLGYADADGAEALLLRLVHDRDMNKELSATAALDLVRRRVLGR